MTCRLSLRHLPAAAALALLGCFVSAEGEETGPASCNVAEDCVDDGDPCTKPVCFHRTCMVEPVADGVIGDQAAGDCKTRECAGGELVDKDDPSDDDDSLLCTVDACGPGGATHTPLPDGAPCMIGAAIGECRGEDDCVIQCSMTKPCPTAGPCLVGACVDNICQYQPVDGDPTPALPDVDDGDCQRPSCVMGTEMSIVDDSDLPPDDGLPCTTDTCTSGAPTHAPLPVGSGCGANLTCDAQGACTGCVPANPTSCGAAADCVTPTCDPNTVTCSNVYDAPHTPCGSGDVCKAGGLCVGCVDASDCTAGGECAFDACEADSCVAKTVPAGDPCRLTPTKWCDQLGACVDCLDATDCGAPNPCLDIACIGGGCQSSDKPDNTPCPAGVCSNGSCVECNTDPQCGGAKLCCNHQCKMPPC